MDRKTFIQKGITGTGIFAATAALGNVIKNDIDELQELDIIGFNHIPNTPSKILENSVLHKADSRGHANHGWLDSNHTFSFANYYNPERMHFGVLRVLNDDRVDAGKGFGRHPHDNMEIISIPLEGNLEHKDSMGNVAVIKQGDIQVMSAGTGIYHSEYNQSQDSLVKFLQIWVFPNKKNVTPRYDQITLDTKDRHNNLQQILSPNPEDEGVWIHQDAWFHLGTFDKDFEKTYQIKKKGNGVYAFVLKGSFDIEGFEVANRDGFGVWNVDSLKIKAISQDAEILLMEVPMSI
ncbi:MULTISPECIES: pirin family protein [unclassified Arcicella]|uniref:pirin family protein n=1 Tax=unclassified Arcicella TaxID=2644986 RepID=UPI002859C55B|nr:MULTISPECIES: pirin family protein [unclassified Arcicella]MDR6561532.1 redox-sensitive bicupin YhaK (pirin superfamily) [Arcicella sp. BE51]MDR6811416.1 redox-sensitive bicupin YhaK (pirin superfamily) [Arcicella sp. BE140]MDR6822766.1 redox-sensitive bicupin YhaK (pirin superfamily) [Arcicella sp. BE139]